MGDKKTIRVTGKGNLKIRPDATRITMTLEETFKEYTDALDNAVKSKKVITDLLKNYEFEKNDIKTVDFSVDTEYESYREDDIYKERFVGYKYRQVLKVEFDSDNERLGKILYGLAHCNQPCEFKISYKVKDEESAKNKLISLAVKDAKAKASILAEAAGVRLKDILSIDYSWGRINFESNPIDDMVLCKCNAMTIDSYNMEIEPDDISASDTVTVIWEIDD